MLIYDFVNSPAFQLHLTENWLGLLLGVAIAVVVDVPLFALFRRAIARVYVVVCEIALVLFWLFGLYLPMVAAAIVLAVGVLSFFIANQSETRIYVANNMTAKNAKGLFFRRKKRNAEVLFDREAVYQEIRDAVLVMSEQKVGAIIVLEKHDSLDQFCRTGTRIDAPVSNELLQTIFYKGTRLHDGAVLIRNDKILAAAVALPSTNRALTGKYGMRHRAAIGISEQVDAVTVIVSEETGRISIAYQSDLETVIPEQFYDRFKEYMALNSVLEGAE